MLKGPQFLIKLMSVGLFSAQVGLNCDASSFTRFMVVLMVVVLVVLVVVVLLMVMDGGGGGGDGGATLF